jgi:hypothetical protein
MGTHPFEFVMAGLVPAIHVLIFKKKDVDARHKAGHDGAWKGWWTLRRQRRYENA